MESNAQSAWRQAGVRSELLGDLFTSSDMGNSTDDVDSGDSEQMGVVPSGFRTFIPTGRHRMPVVHGDTKGISIRRIKEEELFTAEEEDLRTTPSRLSMEPISPRWTCSSWVQAEQD